MGHDRDATVADRRTFLRFTTGLPLLWLGASFLSETHSQGLSYVPAASKKSAKLLSVIDYGNSFISGTWTENRVRFFIESRTRIIDERTGRHEDFYQCAACKSENTFAEKDLFVKDNYDFIPIFGPDDGVLFRRNAYLNPDYRQSTNVNKMWDGQVYKLRRPRSSRVLSSNEGIRRATHAGIPLVAQTEIADTGTGLRGVIEFPIKTMNIHDAKNKYQVDTGPVAYPDLSKRYDRLSDSLSLAFVAFNTPHFADFVIEDVTPLVREGHEVTRVRHYSRIVSLPAQNRVFAVSL